MHPSKSLLAEFIGTFALIFIGAGAVTVLAPNAIAAVALAHGFVIMTFAYTFGKDSGSYINPAVTLSVVVAGELTLVEAIPIILAELLGGIMGALLLLAIYGHAAPNHLGATLIDLQRTSVWGGFLLEAIGTFFLTNAALNTAVRGTAGRFAPFAIGMTVTLCIIGFRAITGGSLNPARTLGPAIASGEYANIGVYFAAQIAGAVLAGVLYRFVWEAKPQNDAAAQAMPAVTPLVR